MSSIRDWQWNTDRAKADRATPAAYAKGVAADAWSERLNEEVFGQRQVVRVEFLERARRDYAEKIRVLSGLRSTRLVDALASVPREQFLGPGPWQILRLAEGLRGYELTPDDDPRHLYDNVLVTLDASRDLNNGEPAFLLRCLDDLELSPRDRFLHVGCGVGYYTAVAASTVAAGTVVGIELDAQLVERARQNLRRWPNVSVVEGDGSEFVSEPFDAIFVNAGATEPLPSWLDQLRIGGRLLMPMTVDLPTPTLGAGHMLLVTRQSDLFSARFTSPVGIFHCAGARTTNGVDLLRHAYLRGGQDRVRSLRRDEHRSGPECWLHAPRFCLSYLGAGE